MSHRHIIQLFQKKNNICLIPNRVIGNGISVSFYTSIDIDDQIICIEIIYQTSDLQNLTRHKKVEN